MKDQEFMRSDGPPHRWNSELQRCTITRSLDDKITTLKCDKTDTHERIFVQAERGSCPHANLLLVIRSSPQKLHLCRSKHERVVTSTRSVSSEAVFTPSQTHLWINPLRRKLRSDAALQTRTTKAILTFPAPRTADTPQ